MHFLALALLLAASASAQSPDSLASDPRIDAALKALGYSYDVADNGAYVVAFDVVDSDGAAARVQLVYVRPETTDFGGFEVRELYSIAVTLPADAASQARLARRLLEENPTTAFGAWGIEGEYVLLTAALPSDASAQALDRAMGLIAGSADALEMEVAGGADDW